MDRVEIQTDNWKMQLDRLVNTYLLYRQLDCGDGLSKASDPPEDSISFPLFMIEVLDSYCSYSVLLLHLIDVNICYSKSFIFPILAYLRGNICKWDLNSVWLLWVCILETKSCHIHLDPCLLSAVPSYLSSVQHQCLLQDSLPYARGDSRHHAVALL